MKYRIFLLLALLFFLNSCWKKEVDPLSATVALVNNEAITVAELIAILPNGDGEEGEQKNKKISTLETEALRQRLLEQLIERKMLLQEAKRLNINLSQEETAHQMAFLMDGMDEASFFQYLSEQKIGKEAWKKATHENMLIEKLLKQLTDESNEKALTISDETVRAYYENNREQWRVGERLKLRQIIVDDKEKAQTLRENILKGADFGETARLHSIQTPPEDDQSPAYLTREEVPMAFDPLFQNDVGSISEVIKTPFGYHLVMIEDKQAEQILPFQEIEEKLKQTLLNRKRERVYSKWIEKLRQRTEVRINEELLKTFP